MCTYEAGDVIRYHVGLRRDGSSFSREPIWVLVTEKQHGMAIILSGAFQRSNTPGQEISIGSSNREQEGREVVAPEDWPDEISVAVAKFQLLGDHL